ncbi:MAG: trigger factor [Alphaproteobacteria bacterium]|nr:trigger factor [Alphaproteobacteria bacterium]
MQITETHSEGLKREFKVVVASGDIEHQLQHRLVELGRSVRLPGFRPGKVPLTVLRKRYGRSVMGEVLERAVSDSSAEALREHGLRPALQPKIEIVSFQEGTDLEYKMAVELLPEIAPVDFTALKLERLRPEIPQSEIDKALERIARPHRKSESVSRGAQKGDEVVIDFAGTVEGKEFPGGSASDFRLELGAGRFIPGFEEQLEGAAAGETRTVKVTFPKDYGSEELAGRDAEFATTVKEVRALKDATIDDALAKELGLDSLDALQRTVREQIEREYNAVARRRLKRALLDQLAEKHDFPVPPGMVDLEFETIWKQFEEARQSRKEEVAEDAGKDDETLKAEYRAIAERRVRLGLLLSEVGTKNAISVGQDEVNRALGEEARRHPGYEKQVIEFYRQNPDALANLRAPIFEDKIVDFILEMASVSERSVPLDELLRLDEEGEGETAAEAAEKPKRKPRKKSEKTPKKAEKKAATSEE